MPRGKVQKSSTQRLRAAVSHAVLCDLAMRPCKACSSAYPPKECKVGAESDKCVECIRLSKRCDLAPFDPARWRRLEKERERLRKEIQESLSRQIRLQKQLDFLEHEEREMVESELQNIPELEEEQHEANGPSVNDLLFDVSSEHFEVPSGFDWLGSSIETVAEASGSS